jgi:hypothetical protein
MKTKLAIIIALVAVLAAVVWYTYSGTGTGTGAGNVTPSATQPMSSDEFVALYVDLELIAEKAGIGTPVYETARDSVLRAHGKTIDNVTSMLAVADTEPEKWAEIWQQILTELEVRKAALALPDSGAID